MTLQLQQLIAGRVAQLTVIRRTPSLFDYFVLEELRALTEVSITYWREVGVYAVLSQVLRGKPCTFISSEGQADIRRMRSEKPLDNI